MAEFRKETQKLGVYIHIPFCVRKCNYCDFLSAPCTDDVKEQYVAALVKEITSAAISLKGYVVDTVFLGGGTPSLLETHQIQRVMEAVWDNFSHTSYVETTIECNPGTITEAKAEKWLEMGINRISFGLQSANDKELQGLGRIHTVEEFLDSYLLARGCGFNNINIDLMSALPYQTEESFYGTLRSVAGLAPQHLSVYSLIVEEGTPLYKWVEDGNEDKLPTEEVERRMYYKTRDILAEYGYERYEVSNYAKKGYECKHNLGYWERKDYVGLGLGASSLINNIRYHNTTELSKYIEEAGQNVFSKEEQESLSIKDQMAEFMFLGLRKTKGIQKEAFEQCFGVKFEDIYGAVLKEQLDKGMLCEKDGYIFLTDLGVDVSNQVLAEFLLD